MAPCWSCVKRHFGGTYRLYLQGRKTRKRGTSVSRWLQKTAFFKVTAVKITNHTIWLFFPSVLMYTFVTADVFTRQQSENNMGNEIKGPFFFVCIVWKHCRQIQIEVLIMFSCFRRVLDVCYDMKEPWKYLKKNKIKGQFVVILMKIYYIQNVKIVSLAAEVTGGLWKYYKTAEGKRRCTWRARDGKKWNMRAQLQSVIQGTNFLANNMYE
jgi:hypothetical protein